MYAGITIAFVYALFTKIFSSLSQMQVARKAELKWYRKR